MKFRTLSSWDSADRMSQTVHRVTVVVCERCGSGDDYLIDGVLHCFGCLRRIVPNDEPTVDPIADAYRAFVKSESEG